MEKEKRRRENDEKNVKEFYVSLRWILSGLLTTSVREVPLTL